MTQKKRRLFTNEQKAETVRIVEQADKPVSQVAKELGISVSAVHNWIRQAKIDLKSDPSGQLTSAARKELVALRRDLRRVEMERDFLTAVALSGGTPPTHSLKKAATFFARETGDLRS